MFGTTQDGVTLGNAALVSALASTPSPSIGRSKSFRLWPVTAEKCVNELERRRVTINNNSHILLHRLEEESYEFKEGTFGVTEVIATRAALGPAIQCTIEMANQNRLAPIPSGVMLSLLCLHPEYFFDKEGVVVAFMHPPLATGKFDRTQKLLCARRLSQQRGHNPLLLTTGSHTYSLNAPARIVYVRTESDVIPFSRRK